MRDLKLRRGRSHNSSTVAAVAPTTALVRPMVVGDFQGVFTVLGLMLAAALVALVTEMGLLQRKRDDEGTRNVRHVRDQAWTAARYPPRYRY